MKSYYEILEKKLEERRANDSLRQLKSSVTGIDFCSNDYLGFARGGNLRKNIDKAWEEDAKAMNGAGGARLISGNFKEAELFEAEISDYFLSESALLFSSGYAANLGLIAAVVQRNDVIVFDSLVHASIRDAIKLSSAKSIKFEHNNLDSLEQKLQQQEGNRVWVVIESVYSMDGDLAPLTEISALCEKYDAAILLDEAHAIGVIGEEGKGLAVVVGLHDKIFARVITFGKALGSHGAAVLGGITLRNFLINFSRPFIYTTGPSPHQVLAGRESLKYLKEQKSRIKALNRLVSDFRKGIKEMELQEFFLDSETPVQGYVFPGNTAVKQLAAHLQHLGFDVKPILSPTVAAGQERLRICLHWHNSTEECRQLLQHLKEYKR